MSNAKWRMSNAEWRMSNAEWRRPNAKSRTSNAEWRRPTLVLALVVLAALAAAARHPIGHSWT